MNNRDDKAEILFNFLYAVFNRKWSIAGVFFTTLFFILFFTYLITPTWEATTMIQVEGNPKRQLSLFPKLSTPAPPTSPAVQTNNLVTMLQGKSIAYRIVKEFDLDKKLYKKKMEPEIARDIIKKFIVDVFRSPFMLLQYLGILEPQEKDWADEAADELIDKMEDIDVEDETQVINLTIWGDSPQLSTDIANRMAELLREKILEFSLQESKNVYLFTQQEQSGMENELIKARSNLRKYLEENNIVDIQEEQRQKVQQIENLKVEHLKAQNNKEIMAISMENMKRQIEKMNPRIIASSQVSDNPMAVELKKNLGEAEIKLASILSEKREKSVDVIRARRVIGEIKRLLKNEDEKIILSEIKSPDPVYQDILGRLTTGETDLLAADAKIHGLAKVIEELEKDINRFPKREMDVKFLTDHVVHYEDMTRNIKSMVEELRLLSTIKVDEINLRVIEKANVSLLRNADWPKQTLHMIGGIFMGIMFGLGYALFKEYWNDSFRRRSEFEEELGIPLIGDIPVWKVLKKQIRIDRRVTIEERRQRREERMPEIEDRRYREEDRRIENSQKDMKVKFINFYAKAK